MFGLAIRIYSAMGAALVLDPFGIGFVYTVTETHCCILSMGGRAGAATPSVLCLDIRALVVQPVVKQDANFARSACYL
jgi:hypothetical protein